MRVITLLNEKGGVGKTTLATHIAAGLAIRGKTVLLIDTDPQGHATVALGLRKEPLLHDLLVRDLPFKDAVKVVTPDVYSPPGQSRGRLLAIPTDVSARVIASATDTKPAVMRERLQELKSVVDFIIIDTAPTPSLLHTAIYLTTDAIVYPTKCEYLSFDGLIESMKRQQEASKGRAYVGLPEIKVGGIVPMMYRAGTQSDDYGIQILTERYKNLVWPPVKLGTVWNQAYFAKQLLFSYAPESKAAAEAWQIVQLAESL